MPDRLHAVVRFLPWFHHEPGQSKQWSERMARMSQDHCAGATIELYTYVCTYMLRPNYSTHAHTLRPRRCVRMYVCMYVCIRYVCICVYVCVCMCVCVFECVCQRKEAGIRGRGKSYSQSPLQTLVDNPPCVSHLAESGTPHGTPHQCSPPHHSASKTPHRLHPPLPAPLCR